MQASPLLTPLLTLIQKLQLETRYVILKSQRMQAVSGGEPLDIISNSEASQKQILENQGCLASTAPEWRKRACA